MNKKYFFAIILLSFLPVILLANCSKKGKLLKFSSQYQLYPQHWQKYTVFLTEGKPEYVVYGSGAYEERWIYICHNKLFNFDALTEDKKKDVEEQRFTITSESLKGSELEKKLSDSDRNRLNSCIEKNEGQK
jgi:hypothetical protein